MQAPRRNAFTMIETVIVLLVMGIMAAVVAPRYRDITARYRVEAAARRIAADLDHVRVRAMMKGPVEEEFVGFYAITDQYEMFDDPDPDHPDQEYWVNLRKTAYPVDMMSAFFMGTGGAVSLSIVKFDMYGLPRVGSPSEPLALNWIQIRSGTEMRTITIDPVTGKASF